MDNPEFFETLKDQKLFDIYKKGLQDGIQLQRALFMKVFNEKAN